MAAMPAGAPLTLAEGQKMALRLLARREHSSEELRNKLIAKGCHGPDVSTIVDSLIARRLLSNDRFVEAFVAARRARGYGPIRIREELKKKGLAEGDVRQWLDASDASWLDDLRRVRQKKFGKRVPSSYEEQVRQARFLQYRGFSSNQIQRVLKDADEA